MSYNTWILYSCCQSTINNITKEALHCCLGEPHPLINKLKRPNYMVSNYIHMLWMWLAPIIITQRRKRKLVPTFISCTIRSWNKRSHAYSMSTEYRKARQTWARNSKNIQVEKEATKILIYQSIFKHHLSNH